MRMSGKSSVSKNFATDPSSILGRRLALFSSLHHFFCSPSLTSAPAWQTGADRASSLLSLWVYRSQVPRQNKKVGSFSITVHLIYNLAADLSHRHI